MYKLKETCRLLGINYFRERNKLVLWHLCLLPMIIVMVLVKAYVLAAIAPLVGVVILNLFISHTYQIQLERYHAKRVLAFIDAFAIIKIFLNNNFNVYRAIEEAIKYVKPLIREDMLRLLEDIDVDKTIRPYIKFAKIFPPLIIEQLMIGLYQLDAEGSGLMPLEAFDYLFDQFKLQKTNDERRFYESALDSMNMWPLIGAGILTFNLLFGVVTIILGALNEL